MMLKWPKDSRKSMLQSSLAAWPLCCSPWKNAWTSHSKTASERSTWRGWLAGCLCTLHADKKPCPLMGEWSLVRNPGRNGNIVFQDLWHLKCFGRDRRWHALRWRGTGDWRWQWRGRWVQDRQWRQEWCRWQVNCIVSWKLHVKRLLSEPPIL